MRDMRRKRKAAELRRRLKAAQDSGKYWDPVKTLAGVRKKLEAMYADSGGRIHVALLYGYKSKVGKTYIKRFGTGAAGHKLCNNKVVCQAWRNAVQEELASAGGFDDCQPGGGAPRASLREVVSASPITKDRQDAVFKILGDSGFNVAAVSVLSATELQQLISGDLAEAAALLHQAKLLAKIQ